MADISEEYIISILDKVATEENLHDWRYTTEKFDNIAQNYFGIIFPVNLYGVRNGLKVRIPCVLKLAPTDERFRVSGAITLMFAREIFVYNVLFKTYQNILESVPARLQCVMPRCYFVQKDYCKEAIVMQNMVESGFKPFTNKMFLDLHHTIVSLEALAKLHALSFIIAYKNADFFNEISKICVPLTESSGKRYMDVMRDRLDQALKKFQGTKYVPLLQSLKHNCAELFLAVVNSVHKTSLCHGDIWKENILYKYEGDKPVLACLIDYQSARISCAAFDTLYLILSSTSTELRHIHYNQLLDIYYHTFDQMLNEAGMESKEIYSRQKFDEDLKVVAPACVITANCAMWLSNGLQEEGHVRSKIVWTSQEEKSLAVERYKDIVKAMIDDCCYLGYMTL